MKTRTDRTEVMLFLPIHRALLIEPKSYIQIRDFILSPAICQMYSARYIQIEPGVSKKDFMFGQIPNVIYERVPDPRQFFMRANGRTEMLREEECFLQNIHEAILPERIFSGTKRNTVEDESARIRDLARLLNKKVKDRDNLSYFDIFRQAFPDQDMARRFQLPELPFRLEWEGDKYRWTAELIFNPVVKIANVKEIFALVVNNLPNFYEPWVRSHVPLPRNASKQTTDFYQKRFTEKIVILANLLDPDSAEQKPFTQGEVALIEYLFQKVLPESITEIKIQNEKRETILRVEGVDLLKRQLDGTLTVR